MNVVWTRWSAYSILKEFQDRISTPIFCLFFETFNKKGYHACYTCKHVVALAMRDKFRIKGFIPIETLVPNNKSGRRKALTLQGKAANLTQLNLK